jgi:mannitol/fructose-specific phosphotransferase system IIA component (Ntr-type)
MDLTDLITEEVVKVPLLAKSKTGVLKELVDFLGDSGKLLDPEKVYRALLAREELASTGLELGIAIPHCKCDAVSDVTIAVGISPDGVDFDSIDGKPSRLFFLVIAAPNQSASHIQVLSEIGDLARSESDLRSLIESTSAREFVRRFSE